MPRHNVYRKIKAWIHNRIKGDITEIECVKINNNQYITPTDMVNHIMKQGHQLQGWKRSNRKTEVKERNWTSKKLTHLKKPQMKGMNANLVIIFRSFNNN